MAVTTIWDLMSHEEPSLYGGADMLHIDSYNVCIGPIELTVCEILKENLHDAASH